MWVQKVLEEMQAREVSLKTAHELIQQIQGLAEEADLSEARQQVYTINQDCDRALAASDQVEGRTTGRSSSWQQVYTISQDWTELSLRLTKLKAALQVGRRHGNRCTPSTRTGPSSRCV